MKLSAPRNVGRGVLGLWCVSVGLRATHSAGLLSKCMDESQLSRLPTTQSGSWIFHLDIVGRYCHQPVERNWIYLGIRKFIPPGPVHFPTHSARIWW